ncbi:alpha/beta fold hydrolase [Catellatospora chokoriensis]|uniref:AB hydrolase-1 domain-containing protein n=1 Tax=Catellatospora chokoriensis TaxID=310353 RepID=A0A8J3K687_9ACTN|nr:alpha/beta hydrolase [Catellatospora chokoriensis]GIF93916.1 hypothetical protein Cch02nite_73600 [Catellatospora chokoriensis]
MIPHPRTATRDIRLVDVGAYRVACDVTAGIDPTIVLLSGWGDTRDVWRQLVERLAPRQRVVAYDRAGVGDSRPRPDYQRRRTYRELADELMTLLEGLEITAPVILVAHSFGALVARMFTAAYPTNVAGLVLIDGSIDELCLHPGDFPPTDGPGEHATRLDYAASAATLAAAALPNVAAMVLSRTPGRWTGRYANPIWGVDARWTRHQASTAEALDTLWIRAHDAGHYVHHDAPDLAVFAIRAVVDAAVGRAPMADVDHEAAVVLRRPLAQR